MPIIFKTKNIDKVRMTKIIRRAVMLNGDTGETLSGYKNWLNFYETWTLWIIPVTEQEDYKRFYQHLNIETSDGIAWGVTGQKVIYMFINDIKNEFILRQNIPPLVHELLHALYIDNVGTNHITRRYDSPEGRAGTRGSSATVIVHDNWYGSKETIRIWERWGIVWIPITFPYIPIKKAKEIYKL